jgi:hypothetical protein
VFRSKCWRPFLSNQLRQCSLSCHGDKSSESCNWTFWDKETAMSLQRWSTGSRHVRRPITSNKWTGTASLPCAQGDSGVSDPMSSAPGDDRSSKVLFCVKPRSSLTRFSSLRIVRTSEIVPILDSAQKVGLFESPFRRSWRTLYLTFMHKAYL